MEIYVKGEPEHANPEHIFLGNCKGVWLVPRGKNDPHVCIRMLSEDDEQWFVSDNFYSSHWHPEFIDQMNKAQAYMEANCKPDMHKGIQYGWEFK